MLQRCISLKWVMVILIGLIASVLSLHVGIVGVSKHQAVDWMIYYSYPTWIKAGFILDPTEVSLHADTYAVILLGQLKSCPWVIVIGLYLSGHTGVILKTSLFSWKDSYVTCFEQEGEEQCETKTRHKRQADILSETQSVLRTFPTSWSLDLFIEKFNFVRFGFLTTVLLKIVSYGALWHVTWWTVTDVCSVIVFPCTAGPWRARQ